MKIISKLSICFFICLLAATFTFTAFAGDKAKKPNNPKAIAAPLDGGLLIALGIAGAGYFLIRKKNSSKI